MDSINASTQFFPPTIVVDADLNDSLMQEEIFGPALSVVTFDNLDEAIKIVKHVCESPLALYVFSNDEDNINKVLDNTASGGVCINDTLSHVANSNLPFGGIGASGMGYYGNKWDSMNLRTSALFYVKANTCRHPCSLAQMILCTIQLLKC